MNDCNKHSCIYSLGSSNTYLSSADFVFKITFSKNIVTCTIKEANGLYPGQNRCSVGTDLGPNCLQRLSAEKCLIAASMKKIVNRGMINTKAAKYK